MPAVGITDGPPPCALDDWAVVLSYPHLPRSWAVLEHRLAWLACSRETHSLSPASEIYGHKSFHITLARHCYQQWPHSTTQQRTHCGGCAALLASALTAATILADAAVTNIMSPNILICCWTISPFVIFALLDVCFRLTFGPLLANLLLRLYRSGHVSTCSLKFDPS